MNSKNEIWCPECMTNIGAEDIKYYDLNGCCKYCTLEEVNKNSSNNSYSSDPSSFSKNILEKIMASTNKWQLFFGFLFILPILDFLLGKHLPYEYFILLRVVGFFGLLYLAYDYFNESDSSSDNKYIVVFCCLAILYNPIIPIYLNRAVWTPINLFTGLYIWYFFMNTNIFTQINNKNSKYLNQKVPRKIVKQDKPKLIQDLKECPFCAEEIKMKARKCKHCGEWIKKKK